MPHYFKATFKTVRIFLIIVAVILSQTTLVSLAQAESYLTLDSFSGNPGQTINVSGGGWTANDTINLYFSSVIETPQKSTTTGADGSFSTNITIPANAMQGPLAVIGVNSSNIQKSNSYYVVPLSASITSTTTSHSPFGSVTVSGTGFAPNEKVTLGLAGTSTTAQADSLGSFNTALTVPPVPSGLYIIQATGQLSGARSTDYLNYFWIDAFYPSVSPSAYYLIPGQTLSFSGSGFAPNEKITITTMGTTSALSTFAANDGGIFTDAGGFTIPFDFAGANKTFTLSGTLSHGAAATGVTFGNFYAYASPTSYYLLPTQQVAFNGGGFAAGETINVFRTNESTPLTSFVTDNLGSFLDAGSINTPADAAGSLLSFTLIGAMSHAQTQVALGIGSFYPSITPSDYYVKGNSKITFSGTGFAPNENVNITVTGNASSTQITTTALGEFSTSVMIPFSSKNMATIIATGAISKTSTSVDITLATFYPSITPSTYYTFPGSSISFSGTGFVPNESVTVSNGVSSFTISADSEGKFTTEPLTIPFEKLSSLNYTFTGALSNNPVLSSIAIGTIYPYLTADQYSATPGQTIHVSGTSFAAGETIRVKAGSVSTTVVASTTGNTPPVAISVPYNTGAVLHVIFTGNSSGATASLDISLGSFYPSLTSDSYYTNPGSTITLNASGFAPNESLNVTGIAASSTIQTDAMGDATFPVNIPFSTSLKTVDITVTGSQSGTSITISIYLAPISTQISPSAYYVSPGSTVTFTGTGFAPNESVSATLNGNPLPSITASSLGAFTAGLTIPPSATSAHFVFTTVTSGSSIPIDITLAQFYSYINLSTYYAQGGSPLVITGNGFSPNEAIALSTEGNSFGSTTADTNGSFTYSGSVPFSTAGSKTIKATGAQSGASGSSSITITPVFSSFNLDSYASAPGTTINMSGSGYLPNEQISITTDRTGNSTIVTTTTDDSGNFKSGYTIPSDFTEGNLIITALGAHSFDPKNITFYVTSK